MSALARTTMQLSLRHARTTLRIPVFVALTLFQPVIWLLLYGNLFHNVTRLGGFGQTNYIQFLAPGVVIMTALFASIWSGMGTVNDLREGIIDRYLTTPASRLGIVFGRLVVLAGQIVVQAAIILVLAAIFGKPPAGGAAGDLVVLLVAIQVAWLFGAFSLTIALLSGREETMIGVGNFVTLPLTFLSAIFIARSQIPHWMRVASDANPLEWAVTAARSAGSDDANWTLVLERSGLLLAVTAAMCTAAVWAFGRYQRTL
jgi:ABC-2 type transport system permease protein